MRTTRFSHIAVALLMTAAFAWGHYTWLVRTHYSASGETVYLELGHGHDFPSSEEAPDTAHLKAYLVGADGKRTAVAITSAAIALKLEAKMPSKNLARIYYVRDRGVVSQTASGWKDGGRDQYPNAKASRKITQYGISWVGFTGTSNNAAPLGLDLELNYESGIRGRLVRVWRKGKPARDFEVTAVMGEEREVKLGKTDREGYVKLPDTVPQRGAVLFTAAVTEKAAKGANYDEDAISCSLALPAE